MVSLLNTVAIPYLPPAIFLMDDVANHHQEPTIRITASGCSDTGLLRSENQDHFLIADLGRSPERGGLLLRRAGAANHSIRHDRPRNISLTPGPEGVLALVADGMGGAAAGELASRTATATIYEAFTAAPASDAGPPNHHPAHRLRLAVEAANTQIFRLAADDPRLAGMGTTVTVALIQRDTLYLAQIGDSRAYLIRHGIAHQLTRDQSRVQALIDAGIMTPEEAARSHQRHIILQALGPDPRIQVDLTYQELRRGDVVVLTTDGLHELISPAELAALAAPGQRATRGASNANDGGDAADGRHDVVHQDPAAACQALIELGNKRGGPDNITAVILHLDGDELAEPRADDFIGRQVVT